jgi:hypothetical protein
MEATNTMQMRINADLVLELTPAEYYEMVRESEIQDGTRGHRNVLASPTEAKADTVEHQKPKAGDLIEVTGDGKVANIHPHGYPVGTVLIVRDYAAPDDRVYAGKISGMRGGMMIHNSFYKAVTRNVVEPCPDLPHEFEVGDIVRITTDHAGNSRNKAGDIGVLRVATFRNHDFEVYVEAREDVTDGEHACHGFGHRKESFELVVAKKDRKDSAVQK